MFAERSNQKEIMDDLTYVGEVVIQTLKELKIINKWLGGNKVTIKGFSKLLQNKKHQTLSVADLGCGGGDMLQEIAKWGRKKKYSFQLTGIDANEFIVQYARENTSRFKEIDFQSLNIFSNEFRNQQFDIITCTLFMHHFNNQELITMLRQLKDQAHKGIVINDLHRHWFAYYSIKWITQSFSKSSMVKNDAPISVLRGFRKADWLGILQKAGIKHYTITWKWAFRWMIVITCD
ncbi:methyltransferase domain-containing protein [Fulvivirgaceae bacterium BMA10]|uniref:Methyltransferase domain-containing protein n=1 Tax=Splendidivirga corallicola TaxID=3051826 RepID=A0ABT8KM07_9BACT|nr:methyltransferase domain-containing protein [Fulvivirgaceae bacterium BMA10]